MEIFGQSFGMALAWVGGLVLLAILFWIFFRMSNPTRTKKNPSLKADEDKARKDRLRDQFARGEISREEYERKIKSIP
jgi:uncharacterized membrane protein